MGGAQPAARQAPVKAKATARGFRPARPTVVTVLCALVLVLLVLAVLLAIAGHHGGGGGLPFVALPIAVLGLVIARRQPGNRIAWLLLGFGALLSFYGDAAAYSVLDYRFHGGRSEEHTSELQSR